MIAGARNSHKGRTELGGQATPSSPIIMDARNSHKGRTEPTGSGQLDKNPSANPSSGPDTNELPGSAMTLLLSVG